MSNISLFSHSFLRLYSILKISFLSLVQIENFLLIYLQVHEIFPSVITFFYGAILWVFSFYLLYFSVLTFPYLLYIFYFSAETFSFILKTFTIAGWNICIIVIIKCLSDNSNVCNMMVYVNHLFPRELKSSMFFMC